MEIGYGDWCPLSTQKVKEDVAGLSYSFSREFHYSHPRTTMLMFGPKNAPAKQNHYLYLPTKNNKNDNNDESCSSFIDRQNVPKGVIMIVTQFDGIPMADCFKIIQYWSFEDSINSLSTTVRIGVSVHFVKYTVLKTQVRDGVKEELSVVANNWCKFALNNVPKSLGNIKIATPNVRSPVHLAQSVSHTDLEAKPETQMNNNKSNVQNLGTVQKDKRVPRKLPKIFFSKTADEQSAVFSVTSCKSLFNAIFNSENRNIIIFISLTVLLFLILFRNQSILFNRLQSYERDLQSLQHVLTDLKNTNLELRNMIQNCPNVEMND